jgi:LPXTG-motif cell wall-anchored protein
MKLRRALAVAAATAAIAPLALLSAPAAFATGESESPVATESVSASPAETQSESPSASATESESSSASASATESQSSSASASSSESASASASASASQSASASPSPSESAPEEDVCVDENGDDITELSSDLSSSLSGLPDTIVAGSGWTNFKFNVSNHGDSAITDIKPLIGVAAIGWDEKDYSGEISVQVLDKDSGAWREVAGAAGEGGTFTPFSLDAGDATSYQLRLKVSGKVPDSIGVTGGFAQYSDDAGCWVADDPNGWVYFFDILAAGSDAGNPPDAKPQTGGKKDLSDVKTVDASGSLAETGSSSALPLIGLVGGVAVVAGAGAVFAVRRRKSGDATA